MKNFGLAALIAAALTTGILGSAGAAQADIGHHDWANTAGQPSVYVPHVDTSVHH